MDRQRICECVCNGGEKVQGDELIFGHVSFEVPMGPLGRDVQQATQYTIMELKTEVLAGDTELKVIPVGVRAMLLGENVQGEHVEQEYKVMSFNQKLKTM